MPETASDEVVVTAAEQIETDARRQGWVSADEWAEQGRDIKDHRSAEYFLLKGEFIEKHKQQEARIAEYEADRQLANQTIRQLAENQKKAAEVERKKLIKELKVQRREALEDGDHVRVDQIEDQMEEVKEEARTEPVTPEPAPQPNNQGLDPVRVQAAFDAWKALPENSWYGTDQIKTDLFNGAAARAEHVAKLKIDPAKGLQEIANDVESRLTSVTKKRPAQTVTPPTEKGTVTKDNKTKINLAEVDPDLLAIARRCVQAGTGTFKTVEEYIAAQQEIEGVDKPKLRIRDGEKYQKSE